MARAIGERLQITGSLRLITPLSIGGVGPDPSSDMPLARDGRGDLYLPGTSLTGALRAWFQGAFGSEATRALWGFQEGEDGHASRVLVEDGRVELPEGVQPELRDGVGIDRVFGSAAAGIKYDRQVLPCRSLINLVMTVELPPDRQAAATMKAQLGHLVQALQDCEMRIGAAKTRGLGRVVLEQPQITCTALDSRDGLLALLRGEAGEITLDDLVNADSGATPQPRPRVTLKMRWRPAGPLMVKAGHDGLAVDGLPLMSWSGEGLTPVLPGSSVKGALRSQAERIIRTVLGIDAPRYHHEERPHAFLDQVTLAGGPWEQRSNLVTALFGAPGTSGEEKLEESGDQVAGLGAVAIDDCHAESALSLEHWSQITDEADMGRLREQLDGASGIRWEQGFHVAIDRWTGGSAEHLLFSVLEPHDVTWGELLLTLDLTRPSIPDRLPALALLLLVLGDLGQGLIPLGYAGNRGMGAVTVDEVTITARDLGDELAALTGGASLERGRPDQLPAGVLQAVKESWQRWLSGEGRP